MWSHSEIFSIDAEGKLIVVAGTLPDAFSAEGQYWTCLFLIGRVKKTGYKWWIQRMKRNRRIFDLIRLNHFRAFSAYWEIPAKETTVQQGSWKPGPVA